MRPEVLGKYVISRDLDPSHRGKVLLASRRGRHRHFRLEIVAHTERLGSIVKARAEQVKGLRHPNLLRLIEFGEEYGRGVFVLDGTEGHSLDVVMRSTAEAQSRLTPEMVALIIADTCRALVFIHSKSFNGTPLVHGAVHPSRVFVGLDGRVKLIDLGLGRTSGRPSDTLAGYLAPEQLGDRATCTPAADLFALGTLMWELLVGERLFECASPSEQAELLAQGIERPSDAVDDIPSELEEICLTALATDVGARFDNAKALLHALEAWIGASGGGRRTVGLDAFIRSIDAGNVADFLSTATETLVRDEDPSLDEDIPIDDESEDEDLEDEGTAPPESRPGGKIIKILKSTAGVQPKQAEPDSIDDEPKPEYHEVAPALPSIPPPVRPAPTPSPAAPPLPPIPSRPVVVAVRAEDTAPPLALPQLSDEPSDTDEAEWLESGMFDEVESLTEDLFESPADAEAIAIDPDATELTPRSKLAEGAAKAPEVAATAPEVAATAPEVAAKPRPALVPAPGPEEISGRPDPPEPSPDSGEDIEEPETRDGASAEDHDASAGAADAATASEEAADPPSPADLSGATMDHGDEGHDAVEAPDSATVGERIDPIGAEDNLLPDQSPSSQWPDDTAEVASPSPGLPRSPEPEGDRMGELAQDSGFFEKHGVKLLAGAALFFVLTIVVAGAIISLAVAFGGGDAPREASDPTTTKVDQGVSEDEQASGAAEDDEEAAGDDEEAAGDDEEAAGDDEEAAGDDEEAAGDDEEADDDDEEAPDDEMVFEPEPDGPNKEPAGVTPISPDPAWKRNGQAMIVVRSKPRSMIYVNGTKKGRTPKWLIVKPGSYNITLSNSTLKRAVRKQIRVGRGQRKTIFHKY